jgi:hypothetical protein
VTGVFLSSDNVLDEVFGDQLGTQPHNEVDVEFAEFKRNLVFLAVRQPGLHPIGPSHVDVKDGLVADTTQRMGTFDGLFSRKDICSKYSYTKHYEMHIKIQMTEQWKPFPQNTRYSVSTLGQIINELHVPHSQS